MCSWRGVLSEGRTPPQSHRERRHLTCSAHSKGQLMTWNANEQRNCWMNNRLRYWHIMVWFVSLTARTKKRPSTDLFCDRHFESCHKLLSTSSPKSCIGNNSQEGQILKKPLMNKQDSCPRSSTNHVLWIWNMDLLKKIELLYKCDVFFYYFETEKKNWCEEKRWIQIISKILHYMWMVFPLLLH